jgi:hypothetical protein
MKKLQNKIGKEEKEKKEKKRNRLCFGLRSEVLFLLPTTAVHRPCL